MPGKAVSLTIQVLSDISGAQKGLQTAGGGVEVFGKKLDVGMIAKGALAAGAIIGVTKALVDMTSAAASDAAEQDRLIGAYTAAGAATGDYAASIDAAIAQGQELAFTDSEIRDALVPLIAVSGDAAKANADLALAQDVARLKGVDLETAAKAVAKAQGGQATALAKLVGVNAKGLSSTEVLTKAQKLAAGQAEIYGKTATGQAKSMTIGFDEMQETIGAALLPVLMELLPVIKPLLAQFAILIKELLPILIPMLRVLGSVLIYVAKVLVNVVSAVVDIVNWFGRAIRTVQRFIDSFDPVKGIADAVGGIFGGGKAGALAVPVPTMRGGQAMPTSYGSPGSGPALKVSGSVTITHKISDPQRALADVPGGAAAVAKLLARGTDATDLYRNLQHAAGIA